jgi:tol-pal system protein YbgF
MPVMSALRCLSVAVTLVGVPLASSCVLPDELSQMQKDMADVQQQLRRVEQSQTGMEQQLAALATREQDDPDAISREELADMHLRVEQFTREMSVTAERMNDIEQRLDGYSQELQRSRDRPTPGTVDDRPTVTIIPGQPESRPPSTSQTTPDPEALYNTACADVSKGNYALAVSGFQEYQERFPQSALADNALYWIAECHFSQGEYGAAIDALDDLLGRYPDSDKSPAANLKKALAFQEQNQIRQAIIQYRYVVREFPSTDEGRLARDKLTGLGESAN